jgi:hypothetical protein
MRTTSGNSPAWLCVLLTYTVMCRESAIAKSTIGEVGLVGGYMTGEVLGNNRCSTSNKVYVTTLCDHYRPHYLPLSCLFNL